MKKMNRKGFTIVELVIVIAVIAILAGVLIPTFSGITTRAQNSARLQETRNAMMEYLAQQKNGVIASGTKFYYFEEAVPTTNTTDKAMKAHEFTYNNGKLTETEAVVNFTVTVVVGADSKVTTTFKTGANATEVKLTTTANNNVWVTAPAN
jgi:prepilin-type N-terminal cleavage/methylation domain-containing protein